LIQKVKETHPKAKHEAIPRKGGSEKPKASKEKERDDQS
jgi:hypothetical protein